MDKVTRCFVAALFISIFYFSVNSQPCPSYTHKDDAKTGVQGSLPEGYFICTKSGTPGIFKSPLKTFNPVLIPNTSTDNNCHSLDLSDDGKWLVYCVGSKDLESKVYVIGVDGKFKTEISVQRPNFNGDLNSTEQIRWWRGSPLGTSLLYIHFTQNFRAVKVTLSPNAAPVKGLDTLIGDFPRGSYTLSFWSGADAQMGVYGNQIFTKLSVPVAGSSVSRTTFVTIPNNGLGIAGTADIYTYLNDAPCSQDPSGSYWGCGFAMSHDGALCLANSGWIGSTCVPNKKTTSTFNGSTFTMEHKGFYITKFMKSTSPKILIDDVIGNSLYGVSINWVPSAYRVGTYSEMNDFSGWSFSNSNDYVIGEQIGRSGQKGIWVVQWKTNTWTLVTSPNNMSTTYNYPVMFITDPSAVKNPQEQKVSLAKYNTLQKRTISRTVKLDRNTTGFDVYSIDGVRLWSYTRKCANNDQTVTLPSSVTKNKAYIITFINAL